MTRRRLHFVIALLLPLMALRAMLPAGYMLDARHGELRMVMCSAGLYLPASGDDHPSGGHPLQSSAGDCVFAHAAVSAPSIQFIVAVIEPPRNVRFVSLPVDSLPPATGPPRVAAARAPPALS
jgi:hypothetical protein